MDQYIRIHQNVIHQALKPTDQVPQKVSIFTVLGVCKWDPEVKHRKHMSVLQYFQLLRSQSWWSVLFVICQSSFTISTCSANKLPTETIAMANANVTKSEAYQKRCSRAAENIIECA